MTALRLVGFTVALLSGPTWLAGCATDSAQQRTGSLPSYPPSYECCGPYYWEPWFGVGGYWAPYWYNPYYAYPYYYYPPPLYKPPPPSQPGRQPVPRPPPHTPFPVPQQVPHPIPHSSPSPALPRPPPFPGRRLPMQ
jgi:hypothetical protein